MPPLWSRHRRGRDVDIPRARVAAPPRPRRGYSVGPRCPRQLAEMVLLGWKISRCYRAPRRFAKLPFVSSADASPFGAGVWRARRLGPAVRARRGVVDDPGFRFGDTSSASSSSTSSAKSKDDARSSSSSSTSSAKSADASRRDLCGNQSLVSRIRQDEMFRNTTALRGARRNCLEGTA